MPLLCISPTGYPYLGVSDEPDGPVSALENRIRGAFQNDLTYPYCPKGFLHLATVELESVLSADFDFLRAFAKRYFTRLCHQSELGTTFELPPIQPPPSETEFFLLNAPPMPVHTQRKRRNFASTKSEGEDRCYIIAGEKVCKGVEENKKVNKCQSICFGAITSEHQSYGKIASAFR